MADSIVQKKLAKLIQQEVSEILNYSAYIPHVMLTVSVVRITRDLSIAKVYVSCFPDHKLPEAADTLNQHAWEIRKLLAQKIKNKVKKIPELRFYPDDTLQEAERIEDLLNQVREKSDEETQD